MAEQSQSYVPLSLFEKAIFAAPSITPNDLANLQPLHIPGFDYSRGPRWNHSQLHQVPQEYRNHAGKPYYLRAPNGEVQKVIPYRVGIEGKAHLLQEWLLGKKRSDGEGNFAEFVARDIFQTMIDRFSDARDIRIEHAFHQLDASNRQSGDKGGDLLLIKEHGDGTSTALCLIDIKTSPPQHETKKGKTRRRSRQLRSGMNRRLSYPLPVIVAFLGGIRISTIAGDTYQFLDYINGPVFNAAKNDTYTGLLEVDPASYDVLFAQVHEQVHQACIATKRKIQETAPDRMTLDKMLYQLALTDKILGTRQYTESN